MTSTRSEARDPALEPALHVVATAGHVDHGKSSLIVRLTGIDPDRLAEERRRGLTIDLGFAWCTLPSGHEIGFVDVPGHERFVRNMLAGVGPVRLVLFVVAADEGWKPQSEEHLEIVDVLGAHAGVVALTKRDLVDEEGLALAEDDVRERLRGTALEGAPIVACSSATGEGIDDLRAALDEMVAAAPPPPDEGRPRLFVDRVFTIKGAGTVVTGTLTGGTLTLGDEVELYPTGERPRVRGLQTHKRAIEVARPVSRVAVNLAGIERTALARGDVLGRPGQWRATQVLEARVRPVRGLGHPLTPRGAYKLHAGSAERDARVRFLGRGRPDDPAGAFARIRLSAPVVVDVFDRFVLREAGRRETVAGGVVLDADPPPRPGAGAERRLAARERATRDEIASLALAELGALRADDFALLGTSTPEEAVTVGSWSLHPDLLAATALAIEEMLDGFHAENPLLEGAELAAVRRATDAALASRAVHARPGLVDALIEDLEARGLVARTASTVRLASHRVTLAGHEDEVDALVTAVRRAEPSPPTITDLAAAGHVREVIEAAVRAGRLVRVSPELVMTPELVANAEAIARAATGGITVSAFRERLGTSRKYALPLLEHFDRTGVTRRDGDLRLPRTP